MTGFLASHGGYFIIIALMMIGLYIIFASENLIKRLVGLSLFQTSVCLFYVSLGKVTGGTAPILKPEDLTTHTGSALQNAYANPLPQVLMLTAIVVSVSTLSAGLAIAVRLREAYGTIESDEILAIDRDTARAEAEAHAASPAEPAA